MSVYKHFTINERESLEKLISEGKSMRSIAKEMERNVSSVSREIKRNSDNKGKYFPLAATLKYIKRRKRCRRKIRYKTDELLIRYTKMCLAKGWSPEIIVAKWKMHRPSAKLSHTTIYRAIKGKMLKGYSPFIHLRRHNKQVYVRKNSAVIKPDYTIHEREEITNRRGRIGDYEGDTVHGKRGGVSIVTYADRKSRYYIASKVENLTKEAVEKASVKLLENKNVQSITLDNGAEFANHRGISKELGTKIYFADPRSPWQRGTNENRNGLFRFFYPKGTDFAEISDEELQKTLELINTRPMKCLGWLSPKDVFFAKCCT